MPDIPININHNKRDDEQLLRKTAISSAKCRNISRKDSAENLLTTLQKIRQHRIRMTQEHNSNRRNTIPLHHRDKALQFSRNIDADVLLN